MSEATIIKSWHPLYTGANGHITNGVQVRLTFDPGPGRLREFYINDTTLRSYPDRYKPFFGFNNEQYETFMEGLVKLEESQKQAVEDN